MPNPNLQAYLASHYLSGPKADAILARTASSQQQPKKKKKRRIDDPSSSSASAGLVLKDDSETWKNANDDQDDALIPQVVKHKEAGGFNKTSWNSISQGQQAVKGGSTTAHDGKEAQTTPASTPTSTPTEPVIKAGLKTKEEMKAERLERERRAKEQEAKAQAQAQAQAATAPPNNHHITTERHDQQTVYRDASGRRIDVQAEQAERLRLSRLEERKKCERQEWAKGLVQRKAVEEEAQTLSKLRTAPLQQNADEEEVTRHFKSLERWDDPAMAFMAKKRKTGPQKQKYNGPPPPPNRYGIQPGYRWDGVDRSNGFEKMLFQRKNAIGRRAAEARAWGQEDM